MPLEGYNSITVPDEVVEQLTKVMIEYEYESIADAVTAASTVTLEHNEATLTQLFARRLAE